MVAGEGEEEAKRRRRNEIVGGWVGGTGGDWVVVSGIPMFYREVVVVVVNGVVGWICDCRLIR